MPPIAMREERRCEERRCRSASPCWRSTGSANCGRYGSSSVRHDQPAGGKDEHRLMSSARGFAPTAMPQSSSGDSTLLKLCGSSSSKGTDSGGSSSSSGSGSGSDGSGSNGSGSSSGGSGSGAPAPLVRRDGTPAHSASNGRGGGSEASLSCLPGSQPVCNQAAPASATAGSSSSSSPQQAGSTATASKPEQLCYLAAGHTGACVDRIQQEQCELERGRKASLESAMAAERKVGGHWRVDGLHASCHPPMHLLTFSFPQCAPPGLSHWRPIPYVPCRRRALSRRRSASWQRPLPPPTLTRWVRQLGCLTARGAYGEALHILAPRYCLVCPHSLVLLTSVGRVLSFSLPAWCACLLQEPPGARPALHAAPATGSGASSSRAEADKAAAASLQAYTHGQEKQCK